MWLFRLSVDQVSTWVPWPQSVFNLHKCVVCIFIWNIGSTHLVFLDVKDLPRKKIWNTKPAQYPKMSKNEPTCLIPGKSLPNPSLFATWAWHQARPDELALSIYLQRKYKNQYNSISIFSSSFFCMNKQKKRNIKNVKYQIEMPAKGIKCMQSQMTTSEK